MPALNVTIPQYPARFDLRDASDAIDRNLESIEATVVLAQQNVRNFVVDPADDAQWAANTMPRPGHVLSAGGITAYEAAMAAALTKLSEALAELQSINGIV